ncbi:phosphatase PAP2 family protein [Candidatus Daviesbacteria bacterium]|nr:phosphatase PAP2 family protein [Candidatus Daviesbacteria bacterium]
MKSKLFLWLIFVGCLILFTIASYTVAKEMWTQLDFDTTVKLQDRIPRSFDDEFSSFSLLGSAEITVGIALVMAFLAILRLKFWAFVGWLLIVPATTAEIFGKLVLYHPGTPVFMHRSVIETHLPSFYIHTNFSYPSGHVARTYFLITVFILLVMFSSMNLFVKFIILSALVGLAFFMALTRIYLGEHWFSDVVGGAILGVAFGVLAAALILPKNKSVETKATFV